jgi:hypothetical protein
MRPQDAISPQNRLDSASLKIIYTSANGDWSLAEMLWDGEPAIGCRWNGDINDHADKGNPRSHAQGTWFILPDEIGKPVTAFARTFQKAYSE